VAQGTVTGVSVAEFIAKVRVLADDLSPEIHRPTLMAVLDEFGRRIAALEMARVFDEIQRQRGVTEHEERPQ
jgi:hypothetical protein